MSIKNRLVAGEQMAFRDETNTLLIDIQTLVPSRNVDVANVRLTNDAVQTVDLTTVGFTPKMAQVRADGEFQWSTEGDPAQGVGPWIDSDVLTSIPLDGATTLKLRQWAHGDPDITVYIKILGV